MKTCLKFALSVAVLLFVSHPSIFAADTSSDSPGVIAKVGNVALTQDEMRKDMGMQLYEAENNLYQTQRAWIDQKAQDILFDQAAKDAGLSRKTWEAREIDAKVQPPPQEQVQQIAGHFARPGVTSTDTLKMASDYLANQGKMAMRNQVYQELQKTHPVEILVQKPVEPHIDVTYSSANPTKGPSSAPVTIVEFTDFECPWCKRSQENVRAVEQTYGDKIKIVARQFPLTQMHPRAFPAAEAAFCAKEQGKYWEYRDKLFEKQELSDADFLRYAKELGLKDKQFSKCIANHKYDTLIQTDMADGQRFGVRGTPSFFVNGRQVGFPDLMSTVQEELAQKK